MNNLSPEEREIGRNNYYSAVTAHDQMNRRSFLATSAAAGVAGAGVAGMLYGYGTVSYTHLTLPTIYSV